MELVEMLLHVRYQVQEGSLGFWDTLYVQIPEI